MELSKLYSFDSYKTNKKKEISNKFNSTILAHSKNASSETVQKLVEIINEDEIDPTTKCKREEQGLTQQEIFKKICQEQH